MCGALLRAGASEASGGFGHVGHGGHDGGIGSERRSVRCSVAVRRPMFASAVRDGLSAAMAVIPG